MVITTKGYDYISLSSEEILSRVSEIDLFSYYVNNFKKPGVHFCSDLRRDRHPSCCIKTFNNGRAIYQDFATKETYDIFNYLRAKYSISFREALRLINRDFNLRLGGTRKKDFYVSPSYIPNYDYEESERAKISVVRRKWNKHIDILYWGDYLITEKELEHFNIYPLHSYIIRGREFKFGKSEPVYCYDLGNQVYKILRPFSKRFKWVSNQKITEFQGYQQLPKTGSLLVITKSMKDVIILNKFSIPAIAPMSEATLLDEDTISELKERFDNIVLLYDNDETGIKGATLNAEEYNLDKVFIPNTFNCKDISDFIKNYGYEESNTLINKLFNGYK